MKEGDYVWCLVNQLLDREEELERLCPECRQRAELHICPGCGRPEESWREGEENPEFDWQRFRQMKEGGKV